jgi:hypothetical protein
MGNGVIHPRIIPLEPEAQLRHCAGLALGRAHQKEGMKVKLTLILMTISPPSSLILSPIASTAFSIDSNAAVLSVLVVEITYSGGATSRILIGTSSVDSASPARRAARIASIPWYAKHLTSTSARTLTGLGVRRRAMTLRRSPRVSSGRLRGAKTASGSLPVSWSFAVRSHCWRAHSRYAQLERLVCMSILRM